MNQFSGDEDNNDFSDAGENNNDIALLENPIRQVLKLIHSILF